MCCRTLAFRTPLVSFISLFFVAGLYAAGFIPFCCGLRPALYGLQPSLARARSPPFALLLDIPSFSFLYSGGRLQNTLNTFCGEAVKRESNL